MEFNNNYHHLLNRPDVLMIYGGTVDSNVANTVIETVSQRLENETNSGLKKRVMMVVVEAVQNIERHTITKNINIINNSSIVILKHEPGYLVSFSNKVPNSTIPLLTEKINHINSLSKDELTEYYKLSLRNNTISDKGGAGLGLIEISRKSGSRIDYHFEPLNSENSNFSMTLTIK
jgi:hypothetical protein